MNFPQFTVQQGFLRREILSVSQLDHLRAKLNVLAQ